MTRVTVLVDDDILKYVLEHVTDLGLPEDASQARVLAHVIALGAKDLNRRVRERSRDRLYTEWAGDSERQEAATLHEQAARETGMY